MSNCNLSTKFVVICLGLVFMMQMTEARPENSRDRRAPHGHGRVTYSYPYNNVPSTGYGANSNYYYGTPNNANPCLQPYGARYGWGTGTGPVYQYGIGKRGNKRKYYYPYMGNNQLYYMCIGQQATLLRCSPRYVYRQSIQACYPVSQG